MALTRAQRAIQKANLFRMRAQMRRTDVMSYVAQGCDINNPELQARLQEARTEEEIAAIIMNIRR